MDLTNSFFAEIPPKNDLHAHPFDMINPWLMDVMHQTLHSVMSMSWSLLLVHCLWPSFGRWWSSIGWNIRRPELSGAEPGPQSLSHSVEFYHGSLSSHSHWGWGWSKLVPIVYRGSSAGFAHLDLWGNDSKSSEGGICMGYKEYSIYYNRPIAPLPLVLQTSSVIFRKNSDNLLKIHLLQYFCCVTCGINHSSTFRFCMFLCPCSQGLCLLNSLSLWCYPFGSVKVWASILHSACRIPFY